MGNAVIFDPATGTQVFNDTDVATSDVLDGLTASPDPIMRAFASWAGNFQASWEGDDGHGGAKRNGGLFERDRYVSPFKHYDRVKVAQHAVCVDDVVSGVADTSEALAFTAMSFYSEDSDQEDLWNQWAGEVNLDARIREMWRELFTVSEVTIGTYWTPQNFKVRGETDKGNKRRKPFTQVNMPAGITIFDPLKVTPVGSTLFNQEQLAYIASRAEADQFDKVLAGDVTDPIVTQMILMRYEATRDEIALLQSEGIKDASNLYLLNPNRVWRHTLTRPQYKRHADIRMGSIFELLDLKAQLRQMERAHLIGGTNFIVLITKGTDEHPAKQPEVDALRSQVKIIARVPVIVGDHRLHVEIVTPKQDSTLRPERHNTIDARVTARLFQMFLLGNYHAGGAGDDSMKLTRMVAAGLQARRHLLKRFLEAEMFKRVMLLNDDLTEKPKLLFHPERIGLAFDPAFASFLLDLRDTGDISRETILSQFDMDQSDEARYRKREKKMFDDIFQTQVPGAPARAVPGAPTDPAEPMGRVAKKRAGRQGGGTSSGGGAAPGTGQGQAPRRPRKRSDGSQPKPPIKSDLDTEQDIISDYTPEGDEQ